MESIRQTSKPSVLSSRIAVAALAMATLFVSSGSGRAANGTWSASPTDADWSNGANWTGSVPGTVNAATNASDAGNSTATFNQAIGAFGDVANPVLIDLNRNIVNIVFDTGAGAYVIGTTGGNALGIQIRNSAQLNSAITMNLGVTNAQTINAPLLLKSISSQDTGVVITNNSSTVGATMTVGGTVTGANAGTRNTNLVLAGTNTGSNTVTGVIFNSTSQQLFLTKNDAGTWTVTAANDFGSNTSATNAGSTTINGGKLIVTNNAALSTNSTANAIGVNINNTGTLEINGAGLVMDNGLSHNLNNGGTIQSNGSNSTNGRIFISTTAGANVTISAVNAADVFTVGNGTDDLNGGSSTSVLNIGGAGTVLLGNSSSYAGGISIGNSATLQTNSDTALGPATTANLTLVGTGKLKIGSTAVRNPTVVGLSSSSATAVIETGFTGTSTLTVNLASGVSNSYAGILQNGTGTLALTKSGLGTLTLSGSGSNSGATNVNGGGTLALDFSTATSPASNIIGLSSALTLGAGTRGVLSVIGKASTANTQTFSGLTIGAGSNRIDYTPGATGGTAAVTIAGAVSPSGAAHGTLEFSTAGTTTLSGNLSAGVLTNAGTNPYATYGTDDWAATNASGVVQAAAYTNASVGFTAAVNNTVTGSFTTATTTDMSSLRFADATGRAVTYNTGTLTARGILIASTAGTSSLTGSGFVRSTRGAAGIVNDDFNIINHSSNDFTLGLNISNANSSSNSIVKSGPGRVILTNAANSNTGQDYINAGVLSIAANGSLGAAATGAALNLNGGNLEATTTLALDNAGANIRAVNVNSASGLYAGTGVTLTVSGVVSGSGALSINPIGGSYVSSGITITDTGTVVLAAANSLTGNINVEAGILAASLGNNSTNPVTGSLGNTQIAGRSINVNNGGTLRFDNGDIMGGAASTIQTGLVIGAGGTVTNNGTSFNTLGAVTLNGGTLTGTGGSSNGQFQMYGFGGTVTVGGTSASTISSAAGTANGGTAIDTVGIHLGTAVATGTTFNVADAVAGSDLNVSAILIDRTGGLGAASLTKTGAGTMTLSSTANAYTGPTNVDNGTLEVSGSITATSSVQLNNTGILGLSGASGEQVSNGATVKLNGGTLAFNNLANQIETLGILTVSASSALDFGLIGGNDKFLFAALPVHTAGILTIQNWIGNPLGGTDGVNDRLVFLGAPVDFTTVFPNQTDVSFTGFDPGYAVIDFVGSYEIVPVPEPSSTAMLGAAALLGLTGFRKRRRFIRRAGQIAGML